MPFSSLRPSLWDTAQGRTSGKLAPSLWVAAEKARRDTDRHGQTRTEGNDEDSGASAAVGAGPCPSLSSDALVANAALSLLNLACHLLDRQLDSQARTFLDEGGFTERLYRLPSEKRRGGA